MVAVIAIGVEQHGKRPLAAQRPRDQILGERVHREHVLTVDLMGFDAEDLRAPEQIAGGHFGYTAVLALKAAPLARQ